MVPAYFVARDLGKCVSRLRTVTDNPLMFVSSVSIRGSVDRDERHWSRSGSQYRKQEFNGLENRAVVQAIQCCTCVQLTWTSMALTSIQREILLTLKNASPVHTSRHLDDYCGS